MEEVRIPESPLEDSVPLATSTAGFVQGGKEAFIMSSHTRDLCMSVCAPTCMCGVDLLWQLAVPERTGGFPLAPG